MIRLYADFNNFDEDGTLPLTCRGSIDSIAALGRELHEGEEVVLTHQELEVIARVFRNMDGYWEARSDTWNFVDVTASISGV